MSKNEERIVEITSMVERLTEEMFNEVYKDTAKHISRDQFKAAAMAEIARRIRSRAVKIEQDWLHFTRE